MITRSHGKHSKQINYNEESSSDDQFINYYKDIKATKIPWTEECARDGLPTLHSNQIQFPFVEKKTNAMYINFITSENKTIYFQKCADIILTDQLKIDTILGYINKHIDGLSEDYYNAIISSIDALKVYPTSEFNIGDYCVFPSSKYDNKLIKIVQFDNAKALFPCQATQHAVNVVIHIDQDKDIATLIPDAHSDYSINKGAVTNEDLTLLLDSETVNTMPARQAKLYVVCSLFEHLFERTNAKYINMQALNKSIYKRKIKGVADELLALLKQKNVGHSRSVIINAVDKREFRTIFKKNFKIVHKLCGWKEYAKSTTKNINKSDMSKVFGSNYISKDTGDKILSFDGVVLKHDIKKSTFNVIVNIFEKNKITLVTKGTFADKKLRKKQRAKRKRQLIQANANQNINM